MSSRSTTLVAGWLTLICGIGLLSQPLMEVTRGTSLDTLTAFLADPFGLLVSGLGLLAFNAESSACRRRARATAVLVAGVGVAGLIANFPVAHSIARTESFGWRSFLDDRVEGVAPLAWLLVSYALVALTFEKRRRFGAGTSASAGAAVIALGCGVMVRLFLGTDQDGWHPLSQVTLAVGLGSVGFGLFAVAQSKLILFSLAGGTSLTISKLATLTAISFGLLTFVASLLGELFEREVGDDGRMTSITATRGVLHAFQSRMQQFELETRGVYSQQKSDSSAVPERSIDVLQNLLVEIRQRSISPEMGAITTSLQANWSEHIERLRTVVSAQRIGDVTTAAQALAAMTIAGTPEKIASEVERIRNELDAAGQTIERRREARRIAVGRLALAAIIALGAVLTWVQVRFHHDSDARLRSHATLRRHNETLKGFAHTIAHDLRAPLRGIFGYAAELEGHAQNVDARGRHCITQIHAAAQNLDRLIGDTLEFAQLDAETPRLTPVTLPVLVHSLIQQRAPEIRKHGTQVDTHFAVNNVVSWERGLVQVIGNLLDNAIKYSRHATPPRLRIETSQTPTTWQLTIRDNGVGFDMKYRERMFGLFQRLVTKEEFEGTGAGLAIVRKITDRLGGSVHAESRLGNGATFRVELPIVTPAEVV